MIAASERDSQMINRISGVPKLTKPGKHMDSLDSLMLFVNADDKNKEDYLLKGSQFDFTDRKTLALKTPHGMEEFAFNPHAFGQLATMLSIPPKYLEGCKPFGKGGMKDQIESRMENRLAQDHLIRIRRTPLEGGVAGMIRAVLPGDYAAFDYHDLIPALRRAMTEVGEGFKLELANAQDPKSVETAIHLRFVRDIAFNFDELGIDDPHKMGFHCRVSEIGDGPISISALVWRLVCSNGMMGWGDSEVLKIQNRNLHKHEVHPQLTEAIFSSVRQEEPMREMLSRKYQEPVHDPENAIMMMGLRMKASDFLKEEALGILRRDMANKAEVTRFDLMQAFTRVAHALPINDRVRLETAVGRHVFGTRSFNQDTTNASEPS